jgi:cytochrome c oxidase assembly protein subunit 11
MSATRNRNVAFTAAGVALTMLGLAYASVPLYSLFCQVTGFGGTTQRAAEAPKQQLEKTITIRFDANMAPSLAWTFKPQQQAQTIKIGEQALAYYEAVNTSNETLTGTAVFNVTPVAAGAYFNKLQCFCFTVQTLKPGEHASMPVAYFVDPAILDDPDARGITEITLSYTFYPADKKTAALKSN